jgi:hypothetical protein
MNEAVGQIKPETLALIEEQARRQGISVDEYLRRLLAEGQDMGLKPDSGEEFEQDMAAFAEGTEELPESNGSYSRENVYFDHD